MAQTDEVLVGIGSEEQTDLAAGREEGEDSVPALRSYKIAAFRLQESTAPPASAAIAEPESDGKSQGSHELTSATSSHGPPHLRARPRACCTLRAPVSARR